LQGIKWPDNGNNLSVQFVLKSELDKTMELNKSPYEKESQSPKKEEININLIKAKFSAREAKENKNTDKIHGEQFKTLEILFKKTTTKPHIYYLPLTEQEVIAKKNKK
jgi:hypothetical protein